ncbi:hypothetical protein E2562_019379 [Oryza meyeriana var. granulata]|uniref:MINDY deubiquitinase domain-containing protein n=1 Tax=Oryza meyeriana var. granulata TaxID=110450 RepID=A0A6G1BLT2_9ORYZ|nr:hypothetical protein E2562_019379 [Oryza meyeriana var. granulata]
MCLYKLEEINYGGQIKKIVCQDKDGTCPLIAVVNYIILTGNTKNKPDNNNRFKGDTGKIAESRRALLCYSY